MTRATTADTSLDTLLSEPEFAELADFLATSAPLPLDGALGVMHAVAVAPSLLPPSAWLPAVLPLDVTTSDGAPPQRIFSLVMRLYNEVIHALDDERTLAPDADDADACEDFADGYVTGALLDPTWSDDASAWTFVEPFAMLCERRDLVAPTMQAKIDSIPDGGKEIRETMDTFILEARRRNRKLPARPVAFSTPKVGRNDPCPCGKGKKFKKCCGA